MEGFISDYVRALCAEIEILAASTEKRLTVHTIFFGGGTPSLLSPAGLENILSTIHASFQLLPDVEISLEANPGTLSRHYLRDLRNLGINRLSLGMQSAHINELRLLERQHTYVEVIQSMTWARQAGFDNLNLDLIFGLPEQKLETWQHSLELALGLKPEHFSLYALTVESGTPFERWTARGLLPEPDPDLAAQMYTWASERLEDVGYTQYEISNWALIHQSAPKGQSSANPILACRHNLQYWRCQPYLGFGAGAHGFARKIRTANVLSPTAYIQHLNNPPLLPLSAFPRTPATQSVQTIDQATEIGETMIMGLRLTQEGISASAFERRFGQSLELTFGPQIKRLVGLGLLEWAYFGEERVLRLTANGRLLGNQVFIEFL